MIAEGCCCSYTTQRSNPPTTVASEPCGQRSSEPEIKKVKILDLNSLADIASIGVWILRGDIAERAGRHEEGVAAFRRAVEI
jgi:hypothetical protein